MRKCLAISIGLHAGILAWAIGLFPSPDRYRRADVTALPVDLVTAAELTKVRSGTQKPKPADAKVEPPTRRPAAKKAPKRKPKAVRAAPKAVTPPARSKPEPRTAKKPEKQKTAKIDRPALDNLISRTLEHKVETKPRPVPRKKPKPSFDADNIAALLNKVPDGGAPGARADSAAKKPPPRPKGREAGKDEKMTFSEIDALRARISQCWTPPTGATGADALQVRLRMTLNRDGTLTRQPQVMNGGGSAFFRAAADSAVRAVWQCQPYSLPAKKYAQWRDMVLNFDPREMFGG